MVTFQIWIDFLLEGKLILQCQLKWVSKYNYLLDIKECIEQHCELLHLKCTKMFGSCKNVILVVFESPIWNERKKMIWVDLWNKVWFNVIYEFRICNDITNIDWQKFNYPFLQLFQKTNIDNDIFISFVLKWQWQLTIQMMSFICMFIFGCICTKSWFARHKLHIV